MPPRARLCRELKATGAPPRQGTCARFTRARSLNSRAARCSEEPAPPEPQLIRPGRAFAAAVVAQHLPPQQRRHARHPDAGCDIRPAAGGERQDDAHRPAGPGLRSGHRGDGPPSAGSVAPPHRAPRRQSPRCCGCGRHWCASARPAPARAGRCCPSAARRSPASRRRAPPSRHPSSEDVARRSVGAAAAGARLQLSRQPPIRHLRLQHGEEWKAVP